MTFFSAACRLILLWSLCLLPAAHAMEPADLLIRAETLGTPIPLMSLEVPGLNVEKAYQIQTAYARKQLVFHPLAGFKAGLTTAPARKRFNLKAPVAGVLFESGAIKASGTIRIDRRRFLRLMIETEIGLVIGSPVKDPLPDTAALKAAVKAVLPVIELPDPGYADYQKLRGTDIIAANVSARQFIRGKAIPFNTTGQDIMGRDNLDLNRVAVTLYLDKEPVNQGKGSDAMGDQWEAALWLVNKMIGLGWQPGPGHILVTGALGRMRPAMPGDYRADFGGLGMIRFRVY